MYVLRGKRVFVDVIKDLNHGENILGYLDGPSVITRVLINDRGRQASQYWKDTA